MIGINNIYIILQIKSISEVYAGVEKQECGELGQLSIVQKETMRNLLLLMAVLIAVGAAEAALQLEPGCKDAQEKCWSTKARPRDASVRSIVPPS